MPFIIDDDEQESSWDALPDEVRNDYIENKEKAVKLVSELLTIPPDSKDYNTKDIRRAVTKLFSLYSEDSIHNELVLYGKFMALCDRLSERQKLKRIRDKTVIGIGGKFSAGKSKFINSVAGLGDLLPENTVPTTSIPTYIIGAKNSSYTANNIYGRVSPLSKDQLQAMTHEFFDRYRIGFSSFVESVIIGSESWELDNVIALLDTPGYNKYDNKSISYASDKIKARDQLKATDFLIWLIDADNGDITQDDIDFMAGLKIDSPVFIVFNKCDKKDGDAIKAILDQAAGTVKNAGLQCYGIAAYSALERHEYDGRAIYGADGYSGNLIADFFDFAASSHARSNDIKSQFVELEDELLEEIRAYKESNFDTVYDIEKFIKYSENVTEIKSLAQIRSIGKRKAQNVSRKSKYADREISEINSIIDSYLEEEKQ